MARDFNGSTDRLDWSNIANLQGVAWSVAGWIRPDAVSHSSWIWATLIGANNNFHCVFNLAPTGQLSVTVMGTAQSYRVGKTVLATNAWSHVLATVAAGAITDATKMHLYLNGSEDTPYCDTVAGSNENVGTGLWCVGGRYYDDTRNFDGRIAELAVWNRVLDAHEIASLAAGFSPFCFPNGLLFAPTLLGYAAEVDLMSGTNATHDGTTVAEHPRIIYPVGILGIGQAAAPPAARPTQVWYQQMIEAF